jgi:hypothetical protein
MRETKPNSVFRSTSVLTARDGKIRYFRSPGDVPKDLQRELERAIHGDLTANVILADEGGQTFLQSHAETTRPVEPAPSWRRSLARRLALEAAGAAVVAITVWLLFAAR